MTPSYQGQLAHLLILIITFSLPAVHAALRVPLNLTDYTPSNFPYPLNDLPILGDAVCILGSPQLRRAPDPLTCEYLAYDLMEDYADFGVMEWGLKAPKGRQFPFTTYTGHCTMTISASSPSISEKFAVTDLWDAIFNIFYLCLMQKQKKEGMEIRSWWIGGDVLFEGREGNVLSMRMGIGLPGVEDDTDGENRIGQLETPVDTTAASIDTS